MARAWYPGDRKTVYLAAAALAVALLVVVLSVRQAWHAYQGQTPGHPPAYGDFLALWSYARLVSLHPPAELYDWGLLHARQVALGADPDRLYPFPYPPFVLFMVRPLDLLPYDASYMAWVLGTWALFLWAVFATCSRMPFCLVGAAIAPAGMAAMTGGQSGLLSGALLAAGIRLAPNRPIIAGILLGLLAYKPQLGLLVPVALVAMRCWRATAAASAIVAGLSVAATLAYGWGMWRAWIQSLPYYTQRFDQAADVLRYRPTLLANLQLMGVGDRIALVAQVAASLVAALFVWRCCRAGRPRLGAASLLAGTILATPHAVIYDLPMTTAALALFIQDGVDEGRGFARREVLAMLLAYLLPAYMMLPVPLLPLSWFCLVPCFAAIVRR